MVDETHKRTTTLEGAAAIAGATTMKNSQNAKTTRTGATNAAGAKMVASADGIDRDERGADVTSLMIVANRAMIASWGTTAAHVVRTIDPLLATNLLRTTTGCTVDAGLRPLAVTRLVEAA